MKNETGKSVTSSCIQKLLTKEGYHAFKAKKKPFINKKNKLKKLKFAHEHVKKSPEFWERVLWSDESKYNVFGSDGKKNVWRKPLESLKEKNINLTVKGGGGSVLVWGCMSSSGVGNMEFIDDIMDRYIYLGILQRNVKDSAKKLGLRRNFMFQEDNDPKHASKLC